MQRDSLSEDLTERLQRLSTPAIADTNHDSVQVIASTIAPVHSHCEFVGIARTVRLDPSAVWAPIQTLENTREGEVIVIDAGGCVTEAVWGELLSMYADRMGAVGTVTNGAVRDINGIRDISYPIFAKARVPWGPSGRKEDATNVAVTVGQAIIEPGDILVGDETGLVVLRRNAGEEIVEAAERVKSNEHEVQKRVEDGETLAQALNP